MTTEELQKLLALQGDADEDVDITEFNNLASDFIPAGYESSAVLEPPSFILHVFGIFALGGFASRR